MEHAHTELGLSQENVQCKKITRINLLVSVCRTIFLVLLFSQYARNVHFPLPVYKAKKGWTLYRLQVFKMFPVSSQLLIKVHAYLSACPLESCFSVNSLLSFNELTLVSLQLHPCLHHKLCSLLIHKLFNRANLILPRSLRGSPLVCCCAACKSVFTCPLLVIYEMIKVKQIKVHVTQSDLYISHLKASHCSFAFLIGHF